MVGASGRHLGAAFQVIETQHDLQLDLVRALCLSDQNSPLVAHVARKAISTETTRRFAANFWQALDRRGSSRSSDGIVDVLQIGATQYKHSSTDYLDQCIAARPAVNSLFDGISATDRSRILGSHWLERAIEPLGYRIEPARFKGLDVGECTARSWRNDGHFLLQPHEDEAQLSVARQDAFEIGSTTSLVAWVCCIDVDQGGELILWDIAPDEETRIRYDVVATGYPYPASACDPWPRLEISFGPGDVLLFRANFLHAVGRVTGSRISVGRFFGALGNRLIYWT